MRPDRHPIKEDGIPIGFSAITSAFGNQGPYYSPTSVGWKSSRASPSRDTQTVEAAMSAWGSGSFDNDDARDFVCDLHSKVIDDLQGILTRAAGQSEYLEAPDASVAVAAAEVIAALKGAPAEPLPREIAKWISKAPAASTNLSELARQAVNRVRLSSELKDLWLEADGLNEWSAGLRDLEQRLL